jgi:hypothetical protein
MAKIDNFFDINMVLMTLFVSLESIREKKKIELIYDIDPTIPKELKGDVHAVTHILTHILTHVLKYSVKDEIVLSLHAPKDFLYEESISFVLEDSGLAQEEVKHLLETTIKSELNAVNGQIVSSDKASNIHINIPFKLNDLGNRRYYRLPDIGMLGKKVLLITKSEKVAKSLQKMFNYFLYEVDIGKEAYKKRGNNLGYYDIFVINEKLVNQGLEKLVQKVQQHTDLKYVILRDSNAEPMPSSTVESTYLIKPVMQESIFELIIALFQADIDNRTIKTLDKISAISMDKYIDEAFVQSEKRFVNSIVKNIEHNSVEIKENDNHVTLDVNTGKLNAKKLGLIYRDELEDFMESFNRSDIYFREIAQSKSVWQIKEFCINLEKKANLIGAQRVANIAEQVSLLFVYNNLDYLPVYAAKYHIELENVIREIKAYLDH